MIQGTGTRRPLDHVEQFSITCLSFRYGSMGIQDEDGWVSRCPSIKWTLFSASADALWCISIRFIPASQPCGHGSRHDKVNWMVGRIHRTRIGIWPVWRTESFQLTWNWRVDRQGYTMGMEIRETYGRFIAGCLFCRWKLEDPHFVERYLVECNYGRSVVHNLWRQLRKGKGWFGYSVRYDDIFHASDWENSFLDDLIHLLLNIWAHWQKISFQIFQFSVMQCRCGK